MRLKRRSHPQQQQQQSDWTTPSLEPPEQRPLPVTPSRRTKASPSAAAALAKAGKPAPLADPSQGIAAASTGVASSSHLQREGSGGAAAGVGVVVAAAFKEVRKISPMRRHTGDGNHHHQRDPNQQQYREEYTAVDAMIRKKSSSTSTSSSSSNHAASTGNAVNPSTPTGVNRNSVQGHGVTARIPPSPYGATTIHSATDSSRTIPQPDDHFDRSLLLSPTRSLGNFSLSQKGSFLHRKTPSLSQYQTTPITKHYEVSNQILAAFESSFEQKRYQVAYAFGLQFVETALLEIPKHGYYHSTRHEEERMQSSIEAARVTQLLQKIISDQRESLLGVGGGGSATEKEKMFSEEQRLKKLSHLALKQVEKASVDQEAYERARRNTEQQLRCNESESTGWMVCEPYLESLSQMLCPPLSSNNSTCAAVAAVPAVPSDAVAVLSSAPPPTPPGYDGQSHHHNYSMAKPEIIRRVHTEPPMSKNSASSWDFDGHEPPPMVNGWNARRLSSTYDSGSIPALGLLRDSSGSIMPPPPPLDGDRVTSDDIMLQKALYLSGLEVMSKYPPLSESDEQDSSSSSPNKALERPSSSRLELVTLAGLYHEDFDSLRSDGRIRVSFADTYQGRLPASTNGCTVIAPLLCIHHLLESQVPDPGLPDGTIKVVIDLETPSILTELRRQLGLSPTAFLIPSDAHDYLIENGQLAQDQFVNVFGGNILDDTHLHTFVQALKEDHRKLACTFFFHEHVIAILKLPRTGQTYWYDMIDSLPSKDTLMRADESEQEFVSRLGLTPTEFVLMQNSGVSLPFTSRLRCLDAEALTACLRWFACSKFSDDNCKYVDQYAWDDSSCDFDPRVFQAFVWAQSAQ